MTVLRLLAAIVVFYLLYRMARWLFLSSAEAPDAIPTPRHPAITEDLVEDPNCHAYLPLSQAHQASVDGKVHYFCSKACCESFIRKQGSQTSLGGN